MNRRSVFFVIGSGLIVVVAVATAFFVLPSPWEARKGRLDDVRVRDLNALNGVIVGYARNNEGRLPAKLSDMQNSNIQQNITVSLRDPVTAAPYEYVAKDEKNYELCATFESTGPDISATYLVSWRHEAGRRCFPLKLPPMPPPAR
jgi:hypothetical protein